MLLPELTQSKAATGIPGVVCPNDDCGDEDTLAVLVADGNILCTACDSEWNAAEWASVLVGERKRIEALERVGRMQAALVAEASR